MWLLSWGIPLEQRIQAGSKRSQGWCSIDTGQHLLLSLRFFWNLNEQAETIVGWSWGQHGRCLCPQPHMEGGGGGGHGGESAVHSSPWGQQGILALSTHSSCWTQAGTGSSSSRRARGQDRASAHSARAVSPHWLSTDTPAPARPEALWKGQRR